MYPDTQHTGKCYAVRYGCMDTPGNLIQYPLDYSLNEILSTRFEQRRAGMGRKDGCRQIRPLWIDVWLFGRVAIARRRPNIGKCSRLVAEILALSLTAFLLRRSRSKLLYRVPSDQVLYPDARAL